MLWHVGNVAPQERLARARIFKSDEYSVGVNFSPESQPMCLAALQCNAQAAVLIETPTLLL